MYKENCLNCGEEVDTDIYKIDEDILGKHFICPECGASSDTEN